MGFWSFLCILSVGINGATAASIPQAPVYLLHDPSHLLSKEEAQSLEFSLTEHERATSEQVVIAIIPSLEGENADVLSQEIFNTWRIGNRNRGSGVLLALYLKEHEMGAVVGYGLEEALPVELAHRVLAEELRPYLNSAPTVGIQRAAYRILSELHSPLLNSPRAQEILRHIGEARDVPKVAASSSPRGNAGPWGTFGIVLWLFASALGFLAWWLNFAEEAHFSAAGWVPFQKVAFKKWSKSDRVPERLGARSVSGNW